MKGGDRGKVCEAPSPMISWAAGPKAECHRDRDPMFSMETPERRGLWARGQESYLAASAQAVHG